MAAAAGTGTTAAEPTYAGVLALCQIEPFHGNVDASAEKLIEIIAASREAVGADAPLVVVVPEVYLHHYGVFDPRKDDAPAGLNWDSEPLTAVAAAAAKNRAAVILTCALSQSACGHTLGGRSFPVVPSTASRDAPAGRGRLLPYNAAVAIDADGSTVAVYGKTHLWNGGGWDHVERDLYQASCEAIHTVGWRDAPAPTSADVGDCTAVSVDSVFPVFPLRAAGFGDLRFGMCICYDIEHANVAETYADRGADIVLVPTASTGPSSLLSHTLVRARAYENHVTVAYCNYPSERPSAAASEPAEGSAVPVAWAAPSSAETRLTGTGSDAFGDAVSDVAPLGFSGESVVYGGDGALLGAARPVGAETVTLVRLPARDNASLAAHKARNPYLADRRTDLACLRR